MRYEEDKNYDQEICSPEEPRHLSKAVAPVMDARPFAEDRPERMNLDLLQNNLGNCLGIIDDEVMKGYITKLDQLPIIRTDTAFADDLQDIQFFKISELVYQEDEFSVDKLAMVFHTLSGKPCTLVLMLKSDGDKTDFYLGARPNGANSAGTLRKMLQQSLLGFFPGSRISEYYDEDMKEDMKSLNIQNVGGISSVTCVADYKQETDAVSDKDFIQGLEKFVYAMQGRNYTALFIADSLDHEELMWKKHEYEQIYTQISPFANMQMNFTVSDGGSTAVGNSEGITRNTARTQTSGFSKSETETKSHSTGLSQTFGSAVTDTVTHTDSESKARGTAHTTGTADTKGRTVTNGMNVGAYGGIRTGETGSVGISAGYNHAVANSTSFTNSVSDSISKTLTHGFSDSHSLGHSESKTSGTTKGSSTGKSIGSGISESDAYTAGEAFNLVNTKTLTDTFGTSKGITLNANNMTLNMVLQKIKKHLERMEECESFGMWNFAAYFLGESGAVTETAANTYKSVVAGADSGIERNAVNSWTDEDSVEQLLAYLLHFKHPQFLHSGFHYEGERNLAVDPTALVSTNELAIHMGFPRHSVRGLPVVEHAPFAQEVITRKTCSEKRINLGTVYHLGRQTDTQVSLDLNSLAMHTFVTGSTGSGKSNAVYHLLAELKKQEIPFLVIEPAKGEYREVFADVKCFGTNPILGNILKLNPFSFPEGVHVLEHIERIVEIFNVCWPMYAAMPAVLKESIEQAYVSAGWDLDLSENIKVEGLFPTFDDVLRELEHVIQSSEYSSDTKGDYIGSLSTRIKSLTNGINGRVFASDEMNLQELFDENAIVDISRVGAMETKSLIMGLIVLKLQEYRSDGAEGMNLPLRHVTVLEEAHNLLKKTSTEQSAESSNLTGKSVEMLTNAIAEIRTYGEGFVIVDQAPNLLDTAAIRNTNTKIVLRLPESTDRDITGGSIALRDQQFCELSKLPTGVAAVYQNDWQEAVLCALPRYEESSFDLADKKKVSSLMVRKEQSRGLLHLLLKKHLTKEESMELPEIIKASNASAKIRKDLILNYKKRNRVYEWAVADFIEKNFTLTDVFRGTSGCSSLEQLGNIMKQNIEGEFCGFDDWELYAIMYYICRIEHEKHPENTAIELLRKDYLQGKVM
ncbi:MAG: DUF87 domain-containing protein [Lachnospiraceae bacterium]|nr:DUF87 domain-containing protein [Lachnospiraceae bacterium]